MEIRNTPILVRVIRFQSLLGVVYLWFYQIHPYLIVHVIRERLFETSKFCRARVLSKSRSK